MARRTKTPAEKWKTQQLNNYFIEQDKVNAEREIQAGLVASCILFLIGVLFAVISTFNINVLPFTIMLWVGCILCFIRARFIQLQQEIRNGKS